MALLTRNPTLCKKLSTNIFIRTGNTSANKKVKNLPTDRALKYFDDFYQPIFQKNWPSIRLALLSPRKYCAVLNNFSNIEENSNFLTEIGALNLRELYETELNRKLNKLSSVNDDKKIELDVKPQQHEISNDAIPPISTDLTDFVPTSRIKGLEDYVDETDHIKHYNPNAEVPFAKKLLSPLPFPENLRVFIFDREHLEIFPQAKKDATDLFGYYLMDASSILPPLLLNSKPSDNVLDLCSSPGGKALNIIQSLNYKTILCNDLNRLNRLSTVLTSFVANLDKMGIKLTEFNAENWQEHDAYDSVLVDVPCTTDRKSVMSDGSNNIFSHARLRERILLPKKQIKMLVSGLKAVKVGGCVVYSTCSLSPIQNDGVVHMALHEIWRETNLEFVVSDLSEFVEPWKFLFTFSDGMRYGQLVLPYLPLNYGPTYFCRLVRVK